MGCASSKILMRTGSLKEEFQNRLRRRRTESYEEIIISKNGKEQFVAVLCSTQASLQKEEVEEKEIENSIETINIWDLLAGLEEDSEDKVKEKDEHESSEVEKGFKRKMVANELAAIKVPAFEFARTGSLRDWLSPESYVTPRIGSSEYAYENKEIFFDPSLVSQLEKAMEDMNLEEEKILGQIM